MKICRYCAESIPADANICPICRSDLTIPVLPQRTVSGIEESALARLMLPVGRSIWAIVAGYMGLLSFALFPAPLALLFGIIAVRDINQHPHLHGMGRAVFAIVMGALGSIGLFVMMLAAI